MDKTWKCISILKMTNLPLFWALRAFQQVQSFLKVTINMGIQWNDAFLMNKKVESENF